MPLTSLPRAVGGVGPRVNFGRPDGVAAFGVVRLANSSQITTNRSVTSNLGLSAKVVEIIQGLETKTKHVNVNSKATLSQSSATNHTQRSLLNTNIIQAN